MDASHLESRKDMGVFPLVNLTEDRESYILRAVIPATHSL